MDVILAQDYGALGFVGDKVSVKSGYARNYLIPRGIAVEASSRNAKLLKHKTAQILAKKAKLKAEAESRAQAVTSLTLKFKLKVTDKGRTFGSIGVRDIEKALQEAGQDIHRRQISMQDAIRALGTFQAEVKLHSDVQVPITIEVEGDVEKPKVAKSKKVKKASKDLEAAGFEEDGEQSDSVEVEDASDSEEVESENESVDSSAVDEEGSEDNDSEDEQS